MLCMVDSMCVCCVTSVYCHLSIYDRRVSINQGFNWRMFKVLPYSARASPGNIVYVVYMCMHACMCVYVCMVWFYYMVYSMCCKHLVTVHSFLFQVMNDQNFISQMVKIILFSIIVWYPIFLILLVLSGVFIFLDKMHMIWRIFLTYFNTHPYWWHRFNIHLT